MDTCGKTGEINPARMLRQNDLLVERAAVSKINKVEYSIPLNVVTVDLSDQMTGEQSTRTLAWDSWHTIAEPLEVKIGDTGKLRVELALQRDDEDRPLYRLWHPSSSAKCHERRHASDSLSDGATQMPSQSRSGGSHGHYHLHSLWSQRKLLPEECEAMNGHVYGMSEIVGTSTQGMDDAIRIGVQRAARTLRGLDWFEVTDIRGHLADGEIEHFQVTLKIGFRMEDPKQA
jgi:dodecin